MKDCSKKFDDDFNGFLLEKIKEVFNYKILKNDYTSIKSSAWALESYTKQESNSLLLLGGPVRLPAIARHHTHNY